MFNCNFTHSSLHIPVIWKLTTCGDACLFPALFLIRVISSDTDTQTEARQEKLWRRVAAIEAGSCRDGGGGASPAAVAEICDPIRP